MNLKNVGRQIHMMFSIVYCVLNLKSICNVQSEKIVGLVILEKALKMANVFKTFGQFKNVTSNIIYIYIYNIIYNIYLYRKVEELFF